MGSKRLPGKVLLPLNGHMVIGEVLTRCRRIPGIADVVCAIPDTPENEILAQVAIEYAHVHRGSEDNVLERYYTAAVEHDAEIVMRVTGDCPLISPELCGAVLDKLVFADADYASNIEPRTFPQGMDCEAFTVEILEQSLDAGPDEHVTTWMRSSPNVDRVNVRSPWPLEGRLTLDTEDDYKTICAYFDHAPGAIPSVLDPHGVGWPACAHLA
jgi:spore coat polysaccharide biosynthesis protein SpsF